MSKQKKNKLSKLFLLALLLPSLAWAEIEGVSYGDLTVNGQNIRFPLGNLEREQDYYWLQKIVDGDMAARKVFLKGHPDRWFFIGEYTPLWLKVTMDSIEIIDPNKERGES